MARKKVLCIGGSLNQTSMTHAVARQLEPGYDCYFSAFYCDGLLTLAAKAGLLDFSIIGGKFRASTEAYFRENGLKVDYGGRQGGYDLILTTSDIIWQKNLRGHKVVLVQEGMTDPDNLMTALVSRLGLPRWLAGNTSTNGLSNAYDVFCVASEGYRDFFIRKGVSPEKVVVTGIPNFDNVAQFLNNDFPYHGYVLVATTDLRETFRYDNRNKLIRRCLEIADGRPLIFKLHPNENVERATREIEALAPQALVLASGNTNHMIANCQVLITQYSSVVYIGLALGKEVHSYFDVQQLKTLTPVQNGGASAANIAQVCRRLVEGG
ncbi:MAG: hypothetical protein ACOYZ7_06255 [Chloroflexota bacterium]